MRTDEVCGSCKWWGERPCILCGNKDSLEYLEEKRWSDGCEQWEAKVERKGEIKCVNG